MALAHDFSYVAPASIDEVISLLAKHRDKAKILAGGTDLIVNIKEGMQSPDLLIDIKSLESLRLISKEADNLIIGAAVSFTGLLEADIIKESFPMLWDAAATVASSGIRNRASLAGNICTAVPSLDSAPALLCHDAVVHCVSAEGRREIPIRDWFLAPRKTVLKPNELLSHISLPLPPKDAAGIYLKLGRYNGEDLAQAGWGILFFSDNIYKIAHCALGPVPARALSIEAILNGNPLSDELILQAQKAVEQEISPISDIRSSREYRLHVSKVMLKRGLLAVHERAKGKEVEPKALLGGFS